MLHFLKYLLLAAFLFLVLNLFYSNLHSLVVLRFNLPLIWSGEAPPLSLNYLLLVSFTIGILFAGGTGALRVVDVRRKIKNLKKEKKEFEEMKRNLSKPAAYESNDEMPSVKY